MKMEERLIAKAVSENLPRQETKHTPESETPEEVPLPTSEHDEAFASLASGIQMREEQRLHDREQELIRLIIRNGEQIIGNIFDENGKNVSCTVTEYIDASLRQDDLSLSATIHQTILKLALEHIHEEGFVAERFFLNYPDPSISSLAFDLGTDKEQLSRMHLKEQSGFTGEKGNTLLSEVEHIVADYKIEIVKTELKAVIREMQDPELIRDKERYLAVMTRYKDIKEVEKKLSHTQGGRVIS